MPDSDDIVIEKGEWPLIQDPDCYCNGIFKGGMNAYTGCPRRKGQYSGRS